jgi:hypothetical protein
MDVNTMRMKCNAGRDMCLARKLTSFGALQTAFFQLLPLLLCLLQFLRHEEIILGSKKKGNV